MFYLSESTPGQDARRSSQHTIKTANLKWLFKLINAKKSITRADLARVTRLSPTTVSVLVDELVKSGFVAEVGAVNTGALGRRPICLVVRADGHQIPVFSLSRWGVRYTLYNLHFQEMETLFVPHLSDQYGGFESSAEEPDSGTDYADIMRDVLLKGAKLLDWAKVSCICVSQPGLYLERNHSIECSALKAKIRGETLEALEAEFGVPILLGNSSMAFAYAEKKFLSDKADQQISNLVYINVTDGIGAGIVYKDEIFTGPYNTAGELGQVIINAQKTQAGKPIPLENEVNTHLIVRLVHSALDESGISAAQVAGGNGHLSLEEIGEAYTRGIEPVCRVLDEFAGKLYIGIHNLVCITGILRIVLGGGIERLCPAFLEKLILLAKGHPQSSVVDGLNISYTQTGLKGDSIGLAQYYIDKNFLGLENEALGDK